MNDENLLAQAQAGEIRAFHTLFAEFQPQLKSYLYRLIANRNDMEDIAQDVFIIAFENIKSFREEASLKTWVFTIATNRAKQHLKKQKRWVIDTFEQTRLMAYRETNLLDQINQTHQFSPQGVYDIKEHIDYCFTCVSKMLPIADRPHFGGCLRLQNERNLSNLGSLYQPDQALPAQCPEENDRNFRSYLCPGQQKRGLQPMQRTQRKI